MSRLVINGRFMSQRITGVQRYALELVKELDEIVSKDEIKIMLPPDAQNCPEFKNIIVKKVGKVGGQIWEQFIFPYYVHKENGLSLNLCNSSPLISPGIVCYHDAKIKIEPQVYTKKFLWWNRLLFANTRKRAKAIIVSSAFTKSEFYKLYHLRAERITVVSCGWEHFARQGFDENALMKYGLEKKKYIFSMSSMEPNKNLKWIVDVAKRNRGMVFAIAGAAYNRVFADGSSFDYPENVKLLGYISDEEAKTLMSHCKAFCYPSFYEGFGIPVLEALSLGTKAICSDIGCIRQVFGDTVIYINPFDPDIDIETVLATEVSGTETVLNKYSWKKSARVLKGLIDEQLRLGGGNIPRE